MLKILRKYGICVDAGVLLLDDALCRKNHLKCKEVKAVLEEAANNLLVLNHHVTYGELLSTIESQLTHSNNKN